MIWHQCEVHRIDPGMHKTTRGAKKKILPTTSVDLRPSNRPEPKMKARKIEQPPTRKAVKRNAPVALCEYVPSFKRNAAKCLKLAAKFPNSSLFRGLESSQVGNLIQEHATSDQPTQVVQPCAEATAPTLYRRTGEVCSAGRESAAATGAASQCAGSSSPVRL